MSNPNDGDAAFPGSYYEWDDDTKSSKLCFAPGMTLRDYFAAKALQGMLSYSLINPAKGNYHENCPVEVAAQVAFNYADAMLAERAKVQP